MADFLIESGTILANPNALMGAKVIDLTPSGKRFGVGEIVEANVSGVTVLYENYKFEVNKAVSGTPDFNSVIQGDGAIRLDQYNTPGALNDVPINGGSATTVSAWPLYIPESGQLTSHDYRLRRTRKVFSGEVRYTTINDGFLPINYIKVI